MTSGSGWPSWSSRWSASRSSPARSWWPCGGWARQRARLQGGPRPGARGAGAAGARRHHQEGVVNRAISPGIYALLLTFVAGLWIIISPFVLEHQPAGAGWTRETVNNVAAGALLIGVSLLGVFLYLALA